MATGPGIPGASGQVSTAIEVDGARFGEGGFRRTVDRFTAAAFTADADAVGRLLPTPTLRPLRISPRRAVVFAYGATYEWHMGSLPPFRSGEMALLALVTRGPASSPPLLPFLGNRSTRLSERYGVGSVFLEVGTTNRVAREVYRRAFGLPAFLADVRNDQWPGSDRFRCTEAGRLVLDLTVHADVRPRRITDRTWVYGSRDGAITGFPNTDSGSVRRRFAPGAARLDLGDHPAAARLRGLSISPRSLFGDIWTGGLSVPGPIQVLGRAEWPGTAHEGTDRAQGQLVVSRVPGEDVEVDQGLGGLPFDPMGAFGIDPLPGRGT